MVLLARQLISTSSILLEESSGDEVWREDAGIAAALVLVERKCGVLLLEFYY